MLGKGFDTELYINEQTKKIGERASKFDKKLYIEFGGKLLFDFHASRVLPGYDSNAKIQILQNLKQDMEMVFCVSARDIQKGRIAGTFGITYKDFTLKTIDDIRSYGIDVSSVVINLFSGESSALQLKQYLEDKGIKVYTREPIPDYPNNIKQIASEKGYGAKPIMETKKPIVIVTGAGPGSGKMSTCLAMVYQDSEQGVDSGYAKFETFPIWNLPLNHPVNLAYEAAAADIGDYNLTDPYHLDAYGEEAVNYNRDVENFVIIQKILQAIISKDNFMGGYKSPTDMGVNMAKAGIIDDEVCLEAAKQEIIRRYYRYNLELIKGLEKKSTVDLVSKLMEKLELNLDYRKVVSPAQKAAQKAEKNGKGHKGIFCGSAIQLPDGVIITGKNSSLLHSESAVLLNATKHLAGIPDDAHLISRDVINAIKSMKHKLFKHSAENLSVDELLVALAISAHSSNKAKTALKQIPNLNGMDMHSTHIPDKEDEEPLRKLGIYLTTDGIQPVSRLYFR